MLVGVRGFDHRCGRRRASVASSKPSRGITTARTCSADPTRRRRIERSRSGGRGLLRWAEHRLVMLPAQQSHPVSPSGQALPGYRRASANPAEAGGSGNSLDPHFAGRGRVHGRHRRAESRGNATHVTRSSSHVPWMLIHILLRTHSSGGPDVGFGRSMISGRRLLSQYHRRREGTESHEPPRHRRRRAVLQQGRPVGSTSSPDRCTSASAVVTRDQLPSSSPR
jgi:hypothetical protein